MAGILHRGARDPVGAAVRMPASPSVVVRLEGGLGNQMFQYAAGRAVALRTGRALVLDPSAIPRGPSGRAYALASFGIAGRMLGPVERTLIRAQVGHRVPRPVRAAVRACAARRWTLLVDRQRGFDARLFETAADVVLQGTWQCAGYADCDRDVATRIRDDFTLRDGLPATVTPLAAEIAGCTAVGVHVRRGDYVSDGGIARFHGALPTTHYEAAAREIAARVDGATCFVFSDDVAWAAAHLRLPMPTRFVHETAGLPAAIDQRLLASCRHFIIANSTFSWWAAWLGADAGSIVIAPRRWFVSAPTPPGLLPATWLLR